MKKIILVFLLIFSFPSLALADVEGYPIKGCNLAYCADWESERIVQEKLVSYNESFEIFLKDGDIATIWIKHYSKNKEEVLLKARSDNLSHYILLDDNKTIVSVWDMFATGGFFIESYDIESQERKELGTISNFASMIRKCSNESFHNAIIGKSIVRDNDGNIVPNSEVPQVTWSIMDKDTRYTVLREDINLAEVKEDCELYPMIIAKK